MFKKLPLEFIERIESILSPDEFQKFKESYAKDFQESIRINPLKITDSDFQKLFTNEIFKPIDPIPNSFFIERKSVFTKTPYYHAGLFYVQEASSMLPVEVLNVEPDDIVLDICASPGSKTTQIISRMQNQGLLIANEIRNDRVGRLIENVSRWGAKNTVITNQPPQIFSSFYEFFDKILLDVPCSGEGMFKKDEDAIKCWSINNIKTCADTQKKIIKNTIGSLKVGGVLVYSTCTMAPEENEENIDWILKTYPGSFSVEETFLGKSGLTHFQNSSYPPVVGKTARLWPHQTDGEGFFVAKLKKIASTIQDNKIKTGKPWFKKEISLKLVREFLKQFRLDIEISDIYQIGYKIYALANLDSKILAPYLGVLKPVYMGVALGDEKKGRIEPSHALALSFNRKDISHFATIEVSDEDVVQYLRGHELQITQKSTGGFSIVTYNGFPIGWGNLKEGRLKNFFPHSMRNKL